MRWVATTAAACSLGLVLPAAASQADQIHACTLIGCESGVTVSIRPYLEAHPYVRRLVVCAAGRCEVEHRRPDERGLDFVQVRAGADGERTVTLKVVMYDARGRKRYRKTTSVFLRKVQPNGPECEPVCFLASAAISRHGRLRRTDH